MSRPRAATVETLGHPAAGVIGWFGGNASASGIAVTEDNAYDYSPVFACTRILATSGGDLPCRLMLGDQDRKTGSGGKKVASQHPVHWLVHQAPNSLMSCSAFFRQGIVQQVNSGNSFSEIERDGSGSPVALWPINSSRVQVKRNGTELVYLVHLDGGRAVILAKEDVLHVAYAPSLDGISGMGVIAHARETIGAGMAAERHAGYTFANGAVPRTVLSHPRNMSKDARANLREEWQQLYGGTNNAGKTAVLWEGMTLTTLSVNNADAQFLETRKFNATEVARWYGVPPHMIGDLERATFSNIEHQGRSFVQTTLRPLINPWQDELDRKLLTEDERRQGYYVYFDVDEWQRGDMQSRAMSNQINFMNGFINQDEVRASEDRDPLPDGLGQKFYTPANLVEVGKEPEPVADEPVMPVAKGPEKPVEGGALAYSDDQSRDESGRFGEGGGGGGDSESTKEKVHREQHERVTKGDIAEGLKAMREDPNYARLSQEMSAKRDDVARSLKGLADSSGESREDQKASAEKAKAILADHAKSVGDHLRATLKADELAQDSGIGKDQIEKRLEKTISRIEKNHAAELKSWAKENAVHKPTSYELKVPEISVTGVIDATGMSGEKADRLGIAIAKRSGISASEGDFLTYTYKPGESSEDYSRRTRGANHGAVIVAAAEASLKCFSEEFARMVRVEQNAVKRAASAKRAPENGDTRDQFAAKICAFYDRHNEAMVEALTPVANILEALGETIDVQQLCDDHCRESTNRILIESASTPDAELAAAVETLVAGWAERANIHKEVAHV